MCLLHVTVSRQAALSDLRILRDVYGGAWENKGEGVIES